MTEAEWLAAADIYPQMSRCVRGKVSDRQWRLLFCACCRQVWHLLIDDCSRRAVEAAERFADGLIARRTLRKFRRKANAALQGVEVDKGTSLRQAYAAAAAEGACELNPVDVHSFGDKEMDQLQNARKAHFLRDIFGNPFRSVALDPAWRTATVVALAEAIYAERAFDRLPILADALEEAGCTSADLLNHCRQPGEHVRGCWAVDLVLGKA